MTAHLREQPSKDGARDRARASDSLPVAPAEACRDEISKTTALEKCFDLDAFIVLLAELLHLEQADPDDRSLCVATVSCQPNKNTVG